jgi:AcrR family transcriptional regulator
MIRVTEQLVAEQGLAMLSLRTVQTLAGQHNKSAAQYHFGSRDGLIEAVVRTRMAPIDQRRAELLAGITDHPGTGRPDPAHLVEVIVRPLGEATAVAPSHWARFLVQCGNDPALADVVGRAVQGTAYREAVQRLTAALDHLPPTLRARRVDHAVALAVTSLAAAEARSTAPVLPFEQQLDDLIAMCTAVVLAPAPAHPSAPAPALAPTGRDQEDLTCTP